MNIDPVEDLEQRLVCQGKNIKNLREYLESGGNVNVATHYTKMLENHNEALLRRFGDALASFGVPFR